MQQKSTTTLIAHIHTTTENQKALLARELHDELGGLLVGAVMDLAWAEQHLSAPVVELRHKLLRARQTLSSAIDMKRKLIEQLRPTLLDNVGLFAALRWHVQSTCGLASIDCKIVLPAEEQRFLDHVPIGLFRIVQESLALIVARHPSATLDFSVTMADGRLVIEFLGRGAAGAASSAAPEPHALAALRHRTAALGGVFSHDPGAALGIATTATFPLAAVLAADV